MVLAELGLIYRTIYPDFAKSKLQCQQDGFDSLMLIYQQRSRKGPSS